MPEEMEVTKADHSDVEKLAELNKRLIADERHPNPMNVRQLGERMAEWLQEEYTCYLATEDGSTVAYCLFRDDGDYYYVRQLFVELAALDHRQQWKAYWKLQRTA